MEFKLILAIRYYLEIHLFLDCMQILKDYGDQINVIKLISMEKYFWSSTPEILEKFSQVDGWLQTLCNNRKKVLKNFQVFKKRKIHKTSQG